MNKHKVVINCLSIIGLMIICNNSVWSLDRINRVISGGDIVIDLKSDVFVSGTNIKVGDVATVKGKDIDLSLTIDNLQLGRAPWPGNKRTLGLGDIKSILYNKGVDLSFVRFEGANEVTVKVKSIVISGKEIANHAERYLRNKLNNGENEVVVEPQKLLDDQEVPLGNGDIKLRFSRANMGKSKKHVYLSINIVVDGDVYKTVGITFNVKRFGRVVVARRTIKSGEIIRESDLNLESTETTMLFGDTFKNVESVTGKVARKSLRPGDIITTKLVKNLSVVNKGDSVVLLIRSYGLTVTARGVCQEDGAHGDTIRVVNVDTKKVLYGNVLNDGTIEIQS